MFTINQGDPAMKQHKSSLIYAIILVVAVISLLLAGCGPSAEELAAVDYAPQPDEDWGVSTPEEQGLDRDLVAELYYNASQLESIYGLLVVKDGKLIAEDYFNAGSIGQMGNRQSVTKSFISALVGIALEQGCLSGVDQKILEFFPEVVDQIQDPRKEQITIQQLLQMRAGYPWEESDPALMDALWSGDYVPMIVHFPLVSDPGSEMHYSNLTSDWLGMIAARACDTDLKSFAEQHLFAPLGIELGKWTQDRDGYYMGHGELQITARDMAKFGLLYLNEGEYEGSEIISPDWVQDSLQTYSEDAWDYRVGANFKDIGYGYQWWSIRAGDQHYNLAWGHGGQQIAVLEELDMVIVVTADPLYGQSGDGPWKLERANLNLVADFIASLPAD